MSGKVEQKVCLTANYCLPYNLHTALVPRPLLNNMCYSLGAETLQFTFSWMFLFMSESKTPYCFPCPWSRRLDNVKVNVLISSRFSPFTLPPLFVAARVEEEIREQTVGYVSGCLCLCDCGCLWWKVCALKKNQKPLWASWHEFPILAQSFFCRFQL